MKAFVFPGQGAQFVGMGKDLYDNNPKTTFHANRPFIYCITEASSGVILFVGKFTGE